MSANICFTQWLSQNVQNKVRAAREMVGQQEYHSAASSTHGFLTSVSNESYLSTSESSKKSSQASLQQTELHEGETEYGHRQGTKEKKQQRFWSAKEIQEIMQQHMWEHVNFKKQISWWKKALQMSSVHSGKP